MKIINILIDAITKFIAKIQEYRNDPIRIAKVYRDQGIKIGENAYIYSWCLDTEFPELIEMGNNVCISANVRILTHDASLRKIGYTKYGKVSIGNDVMIGYGSIILPNTHLGNDVIVGAGAVVKGDIPDNSIVIGNPCKIVGKTSDYFDREKDRINDFISKNSCCNDNFPPIFYVENDSVIKVSVQ